MLKNQIKNTPKLCYLFLLGLLVLFACSKEKRSTVEILAQIGDKVITKDEFIQRAEYTIRPAYCRGDNYIHRKIVLNSLIAEKLMSLEAGDSNSLTQNEQFQLYLQGRKEQSMRQWLFYNDFYHKIKPDSSKIKKIYKLSNRTYKLAYYAIKDTAVVPIVRRKLQSGKSFEQTFRELGGLEAIPKREVSWDNPEHEVILEALFTQPVEKGQVLGPLKIENNHYITLKVLGWTEKVLLADQAVQTRINDVSERIKTTQANANYDRFVKELMTGKKITFNPQVFKTVVNSLGPFYIKTEQDKKDAFNQQFWNQNRPENPSAGVELDNIYDQIVLTIDGENWTVKRLMREIAIHPLVFRKRQMRRNEFGEQFKFAIADLIRDKYVTQEAYQRRYDQVESVRRNVAVWYDYLNGLYYKNEYLKSINQFDNFSKDYLQIVETYLNPFIDSLQVKYSSEVEINTDLFERIELTGIDMFAIQKNVPFGVLVPSFPILTTDNRLDYGRKMENPN